MVSSVSNAGCPDLWHEGYMIHSWTRCTPVYGTLLALLHTEVQMVVVLS